MRAVELGMRALAGELEVSFPFPKELAEWANLIDQIESKIKVMRNRPKGTKKDEDLKFYSEAGCSFDTSKTVGVCVLLTRVNHMKRAKHSRLSITR